MTNDARDLARQAMNDRAQEAAKAVNQGPGDSRVLAFNAEATAGFNQTILDGRIAAALPGPFAAVDAACTVLRFNTPLAELFPSITVGAPITDVIEISELSDLIQNVISGTGDKNSIDFEPAMCGGADDDDDRIFRLTASILDSPDYPDTPDSQNSQTTTVHR